MMIVEFSSITLSPTMFPYPTIYSLFKYLALQLFSSKWRALTETVTLFPNFIHFHML